MTWYQEWFGEEYLDLYSYRDEEEARLQVDFFASRIGPISRPVLDLACGSGRHLQELRSRGYRSFGCDLSYVLLRTAIRDADASVARADMRRIREFYERQDAGVGDYFISRTQETLLELQSLHGSHAKRFGLYRALVPKFHHAVFYREHSDHTEVVAVVDLRRDPKWIRRQLHTR